MRIDYLSTSEIISNSANAVHVMRMSAAMASLGHTVTLHAIAGTGADDAEVFRYYAAPRNFALQRYRFNDRTGPRLLMALRRFGLPTGYAAQLLHAWFVVRHEVGKSSLLYARNAEWLLASLGSGHRFIFESHQLPADPRVSTVHRRLFEHSGFLGLVVISEALRTAYLSAYPHLSARRVIVAADGADKIETESFENTPNSRLQIGHVGHLYPGRGGELMIDIARALPGMDFHLVGGRSEDIARLKALMPPDNLTFHGHRPPSELPEFYRKFDVAIAPYQKKIAVAGGSGDISRWISPMKIFEYMSFAKPIVASDIAVIREVLVPGHTAILVDPDNLAGWIRAVQRLMENPEERRKLGQHALANFESRYTWRSRASRILDTLDPDPR